MNTLALPPELWLGIMKLMRRRNLCSLALVNRHLSEIARSELFTSFSYKALDPANYDDGQTQFAKERQEIHRFLSLAEGPARFARIWSYTRYHLHYNRDPDEERELQTIR